MIMQTVIAVMITMVSDGVLQAPAVRAPFEDRGRDHSQGFGYKLTNYSFRHTLEF